jgi:uncharacterized protein
MARMGERTRVPWAVDVLAKPTGARCNLDCAYCFFLSKEQLYPSSDFRMSDETLEAYLRELFGAHDDDAEVALAWQGGEPTLMGLEFFRRAFELAERQRKPGQRIRHSLQTNGTYLDAEWAKFLREHRVLVGLSLDGPRDVHDGYRVDRGGTGSFEDALRGWRALQEGGVEYNVLCTVHALNQERGREVYRFFRDELDARFVQFIPVVERVAELPRDGEAWSSWRDRPLYTQTGEHVTRRSVDGEEWGRFLVDVFEEWVRRDVGRVYVQMFDVALANWAGEPAGLCVHTETCGGALALEHNGDLYSCDHYVEPAHRLGNVREQSLRALAESPEQLRFGRAKRDRLPSFCIGCDVRFACHGGCPKDRFTHVPTGEPGLNYLCAGYKLFFHHVDRPMRYMRDQLRRGLAPADIMRVYALEDAARNRNDTCTCASGRKWKRCHGA